MNIKDNIYGIIKNLSEEQMSAFFTVLDLFSKIENSESKDLSKGFSKIDTDIQFMKDSNYYIVYGWMGNKLNLKGNEKEAYAIIYSYYLSGIDEVNASLKYFAETIHCNERTASTALTNLSKKGLISKTIGQGMDGGWRNKYRINHQILIDKGIEKAKE